MRNRFILTKEKNPQLLMRMRNSGLFNITWTMILLTIFMWQCKEDDFKGETSGVCPEVISTDPVNNGINVVASKKITATFNENMDPATINTTTFLLSQGTNAISGEVTPTSGETATFTFTPASPLSPFTLYTATMKKGVKDPMSNMLQADYVWTFTTQPQVTLTSNPLIGGTTTGGGSFDTGTSVTVKAVASSGYVFANWTEGGVVASSNADYTFEIAGNRTLIANFTAQYGVTLSSLPLAGGTTSGGGIFNTGASVTISATPNAGYTFTNWTEGTTAVSALKEYTFELTTNRVLVANFAINMYTLNITALNGTVAKNPDQATFSHGTNVELTATPAPGYTFTSWSGDATGTTNTTSVTMNSDKNVIANFSAIQYTVALSSNPLLGGTTTGAGSFNSGASVTVRATPAVGYSFTNWTEGANIISTDANYTFTISGNKTFVANFTAIQYTVALSSNPLLGGTTTGAGSYNSGASVTVRATPAVGYSFTNWTEGANIVSTDANYTFTINEDKVFVANFTANTVQYTVELSSNPLLGGTTTGAGSYNSGASVTVRATPAVGYTFTNWTEGANIVSTDANYTFTINEDKVFVAHFTANTVQYTVELSSSPLLGGTTTGAGSYNSGASVTVRATPAVGYTFTNWTEGANIVSTDANYTFTINEDKVFVANFTANTVQYTVELSSSPLLGGTTTGAGSYNSGASVTVRATPAVGYTFTNWTEGANIVSTDANYTFTINEDKVFVANFTAEAPAGPLAIDLDCAAPYAIMAGSTITSTGLSIINGDVALSPGSALVGFPPGIINGVQEITTPEAASAKLCLTTAYNDGQSRSLNAISLPGQLGGLTLAPGLYSNSSTSGISGTGPNGILTLDAGGNADAVWIFQIGSTLTTDSGTSIVLAGGAQAKNIFWVVGTSATLGTTSVFYGNILADQSITLNTGSTLYGRALTRIAAVTLDASIINKP